MAITRVGNHEGARQVGHTGDTSATQETAVLKKVPSSGASLSADATQDVRAARYQAGRLGHGAKASLFDKGPFERIEPLTLHTADFGFIGAVVGAAGAYYSTGGGALMSELMLQLAMNTLGGTTRPVDTKLLLGLIGQPPASSTPKQLIMITDGSPGPGSAERAVAALKANGT